MRKLTGELVPSPCSKSCVIYTQSCYGYVFKLDIDMRYTAG